MAMTIGELVAKLSADVSDFQRGMASAKDSIVDLTGAANEASDKFDIMGKSATEVNQALELLHKAKDIAMEIFEVSKASAEWADHVTHLSQEFNVSTDQIQIWQTQMAKAGQPVDAMTFFIQRLSNAMTQARTGANQFSALLHDAGVDLASTDMAENVHKVVVNLGAMGDATEKAIRLRLLGGRTALTLFPSMLQMAQDPEAARAESERLGMLSEDKVETLKEQGHAIQNMNTAWENLKRTLSADVSPAMTELLEKLIELLVIVREDYPIAIDKLTAVWTDFQTMMEALHDSIPAGPLANLFGPMIDAIEHPLDTILKGIKDIGKAILEVITAYGVMLDVMGHVATKSMEDPQKGWLAKLGAGVEAFAQAFGLGKGGAAGEGNLVDIVNAPDSQSKLIANYYKKMLDFTTPLPLGPGQGLAKGEQVKWQGLTPGNEDVGMTRKFKSDDQAVSDQSIANFNALVAASLKASSAQHELTLAQYKTELAAFQEAEAMKTAIVQGNVKLRMIDIYQGFEEERDIRQETLKGQMDDLAKREAEQKRFLDQQQQFTMGNVPGQPVRMTLEEAMKKPELALKLNDLNFTYLKAMEQYAAERNKLVSQMTQADMEAFTKTKVAQDAQIVANNAANTAIAKSDLDAATIRGESAEALADREMKLLHLQEVQEIDSIQRRMKAGTLDRAIGAAQIYALTKDNAEKMAVLSAKSGDDFAAGWVDGMNKFTQALKTGYDLALDMAMSTAQAMQSGFQTLFFDAFQNKLKSWKDYFTAALTSVNQIVSQFLSKWLMAQIMGEVPGTGSTKSGMGGMSGIGGVMSGASGMASGLFNGNTTGFGGNTIASTNSLWTSLFGADMSNDVSALTAAEAAFAEGGVVSGPTHALVGESGPEAIIPLDRMGKMGGHTTVHMNITTPDVGSFRQSRDQILVEMQRAMVRAQRNV